MRPEIRIEAFLGNLPLFREARALGSGTGPLVAYLLRRAPPDARGAFEVALPVAKRALASRLNVSAEHLSRIPGELQDRTLPDVRGRRLRIVDAARLRVCRVGHGRAGSDRTIGR